MVVDCHIHLNRKELGGIESAGQILKFMDKAKIDKAFLFSPPPIVAEPINQRLIYRRNQERQKESIQIAGKIVAQNPERLVGFVWLDPLLPNAKEELERAVIDYKLRGVKMIPDHWYPFDEKILPIYEKIQAFGVPIIFHSGMLSGLGDSSRFCRPAFFEVLLHFPKIKFALAHTGWPWIDECIATAARFEAVLQSEKIFQTVPEKDQSQQGISIREPQMFIDITGTWETYKKEALRKAIANLGEDRLIYGSDTFLTLEDIKRLKDSLQKDKRILKELGLSSKAQGKIMGENAVRFVEKW